MNQKLVVASVVGLILGLGVGGFIGHLATFTVTETPTDEHSYLTTTDQWLEGMKDDTNQWIINEIKTENIEKHLRYLSAEPHLAATPRDNELAEHIKQHFLNSGFDWAEKLPYDVYLSRPDPDKPNKIYIRDGSGNEIFTSQHREEFGSNVTNFVDAFNAYTPAGESWSEAGEGVVYVNYGRVEDFQELETLGISSKGRIAMMRYGKIYRGNKIKNAQDTGATGAILFSDPWDVAQEGHEPEDVYPNSWWLPETGMQRGSAYLGDGDPLTPGWPSTKHAHRVKPSEAGFLRIPAQPIGYADAQQILQKLGGPTAPKAWQGKLELQNGDGKYRLGPNFVSQFSDHRLQLITYNTGAVYPSYNVIATIRGAVEPDRYVLLGNHRDAWGFGASDPSSGTAQMLETARVLGDLRKKGWRPRRTIVFCSWGAEEYGFIGSTEWVEEHVSTLQARAVAYINTDTCATGPVLEVPGSPLLWDMIRHVTKLVPGVRDPKKTVFDEWRTFHEDMNPNAHEKPVMKTLGSGSDYAHFFIYAGVPAMDIWFRRDKRVNDITIYPSYHTGFETFEMVRQFNDPGFRSTQGCGRLASLTLKYLADSLVLPLSLSRFPASMADALHKLDTVGTRDKIMAFYPDYKYLEEAVLRLSNATQKFHHSITGQDFNPVQLRRVNDQLIQFEQTFIIPGGLPNRPVTRHAVFAPSQFDNYASAVFPGIVDLMHGYDKLSGGALQQREEALRTHISLLTILTDRASAKLRDVHVFG